MFRPAITGFAVILLTLILGSPGSTAAKSVKDFESMATSDQSAFVIGFLDKMTNDLGNSDPVLAQNIRNYFSHKQPGKVASDGLERFFAELIVVENRAKEGKADLSKIQVESIVVYVVKQKFPPPAAAQK